MDPVSVPFLESLFAEIAKQGLAGVVAIIGGYITWTLVKLIFAEKDKRATELLQVTKENIEVLNRLTIAIESMKR